MPRYDDIYLCPVCHEPYATEDLARECRDGHTIDETAGIICDCGAAFFDDYDFERHALHCTFIEPSCISCNNYDRERNFRHAPCERASFSPEMSPCDQYRKIKVC